MLFEYWDKINWIGAGCIMALILFSCYAVLELSWAKNRNFVIFVPILLFVGLAGLIFTTAAPTHSFMEREFWQGQLEYEASMELVEQRVAEELERMTVDFSENLPVYCTRGYPHARTDAQVRHCTALEINRLIENYHLNANAK